MPNCDLSLSHLVSWDRCGTWLYRFLILAVFLTWHFGRDLICFCPDFSLHAILVKALFLLWNFLLTWHLGGDLVLAFIFSFALIFSYMTFWQRLRFCFDFFLHDDLVVILFLLWFFLKGTWHFGGDFVFALIFLMSTWHFGGDFVFALISSYITFWWWLCFCFGFFLHDVLAETLFLLWFLLTWHFGGDFVLLWFLLTSTWHFGGDFVFALISSYMTFWWRLCFYFGLILTWHFVGVFVFALISSYMTFWWWLFLIWFLLTWHFDGRLFLL